jgi:hypothetical protein
MILRTELAYVTAGYGRYGAYYERLLHALLEINPPQSEFCDSWRQSFMRSISRTLTADVFHTEHTHTKGEQHFRTKIHRVTLLRSFILYDPAGHRATLPPTAAQESSDYFVLKYLIRVGDSHLLAQLDMMEKPVFLP